MFSGGRIIASLSSEERAMFTERIKFLDRKIQPGLTKLTWSARSVAESFVQECRLQAAKVVTNFNSSVANQWRFYVGAKGGTAPPPKSCPGPLIFFRVI